MGLNFIKVIIYNMDQSLPLIDAKIAISNDYYTKNKKKMDYKYFSKKITL